VKDRILQHALLSGYTGRLMKGRYPVAVLFVRVPFDRVDVNVHPTKNEVRFADAGRVHDQVEQAVRRVLAGADRPDWQPKTAIQDSRFKIQPSASGVGGEHRRSGFAGSETQHDNGYTVGEAAEGWVPEKPSDHRTSATETRPRQEGLWESGRFSDLRVVGQFANSYIVCEADRRLVLVDQHAAHERILYEQIRSRSGISPSQGLLLSETVSFSPREAAAFVELIPGLAAEGFDIEPFGGEDFVVRAVPALLTDREIGPILQEIAEKAVEIGVAGKTTAIDAVQKILACHGAVRAHQAMTEKQMAALLAELDACTDPAHCPHGRPTWIEWPEAELEKRFGR
jgi:DNA mismatch repair protein MutL